MAIFVSTTRHRSRRPVERLVERQPPEWDSSQFLPFVFYLFIGLLCWYALVNIAKESFAGELHKENNATALLYQRTTPTESAHAPAIPTPSGMPLFDLPRGHVGDLEYGVPIFTCRNPGQIALTFEDGPSQYTQDILDLLDHYDFKGTFFMTGTNTSVAPAARHTHIDDEETGWPALLSRIHETGHQFASHTYTRARLDGISSQGVAEEMVYNEMAFRNAIGLIPAYMRPPFDVWRDPAVREQLDGLGYHIILHDIDTRDYENDGENTIQKSVEIFNNAIRFDGNGSYIVRMQDTRQWTAMKLLPAVLESMEVRGYKGVTVGQCLDDAFFYWYRQPEA